MILLPDNHGLVRVLHWPLVMALLTWHRFIRLINLSGSAMRVILLGAQVCLQLRAILMPVDHGLIEYGVVNLVNLAVVDSFVGGVVVRC
jgi:hypothetical protein